MMIALTKRPSLNALVDQKCRQKRTLQRPPRPKLIRVQKSVDTHLILTYY